MTETMKLYNQDGAFGIHCLPYVRELNPNKKLESTRRGELIHEPALICLTAVSKLYRRTLCNV